jgi:hypothetical protein
VPTYEMLGSQHSVVYYFRCPGRECQGRFVHVPLCG